MSKTRTNDEFLKLLKEKNSNIECLEPYIRNSIKIKFRCKIDGYEWYTTPNKIINQGRGCPLCGGSLKWTNEQFIEFMKQKNPSLEFIDEYINDSTKLHYICNVCKNIGYNSPTHLKTGQGCYFCQKKKIAKMYSKGLSKFKKELKRINSDLEVIGEYKNGKENIQVKCNICNKEFYAAPTNLLRGGFGHKCILNSSYGENEVSKK